MIKMIALNLDNTLLLKDLDNTAGDDRRSS